MPTSLALYAWLLASFLLACVPSHAGPTLHRELIPHPDGTQKKIELIWAAPESGGPFSTILYVHGHQDGPRPGAEHYVEKGILEKSVGFGRVAAAVSQPGYGRSDGPPDYCGPSTQQAVLAAIEWLRKLPMVDPARIGLNGYSRGAAVAALVAEQDPKIAALILGGGLYDLAAVYQRTLPAIKRNIKAETGATAEAFRARSALELAGKIKAPTLILHGEDDDRDSAADARAMAEKISQAGTPVVIRVFPKQGHLIRFADQQREVAQFLAKHFRP